MLKAEQPDCETCRGYEASAFRCLAEVACDYEPRSSEVNKQ